MLAHAADPATPLEDLFLLAGFFPGEVLSNPAFPIGVLTEPSMVTAAPPRLEGGAAALAAHPTSPEWYLALALDARSSRVALAAITNPNTPLEALEAAVRSYAMHAPADPLVAGLRRGRFTEAALHRLPFDRALALALAVGQVHAFKLLASHPGAGFSDALAALELAGEMEIAPGDGPVRDLEGVRREYLEALAGRGDAPEGFLLELVAGGDPRLASAAGRSPKATAIVMQLAYERVTGATAAAPVLELYVALAGSPTAPARVLTELARHRLEAVRVRVAGNPSSPFEVLRGLAGDESLSVVEAVAGNPGAPTSFIRSLLGHPSARIRCAAARHPKVTWDTLPMDDPILLGAALQNPNVTDEGWRAALHVLDEDANLEVLEALAWKGAAPDWAHSRLLSHRDAEVRRGALADTRTTPAQLRAASADPNPEVRSLVATHPRTPDDVLASLMQDCDSRVRDAAVRAYRDWVHLGRSHDEVRPPTEYLDSATFDHDGVAAAYLPPGLRPGA